MTEVTAFSELQVKQELLSEALANLGINFPKDPDQNPDISMPRPWLVRGTGNLSILSDGQGLFMPQDGEMGTNGVFFGDCLKSLMYPSKGAFFVFPTSSVASNWLITPSLEYQQELERVASERHLSLTTITGGVEAESEVYRRNNIYQKMRGIATVASPVEVERATAILTTHSILHNDDLAKIPHHIKNKLVELSGI